MESKLDDVEAVCAGSMDEDEDSVEVEDDDKSVGKSEIEFPEEGIHEDCNWWQRSDRVVVQDAALRGYLRVVSRSVKLKNCVERIKDEN